MNLLIINAGSTTLKFTLYGGNFNVLKKGNFENIGIKIKDHEEAFKKVLEVIEREKVDAVGYRVVHGGDKFFKLTKITPFVLKELEKFNELAPLHNPPTLFCIKASIKLLPKVPDFAVFDTGFYKDLPEIASRYPIPYEYLEKFKIKRYGFHGISHEYIAGEAAKILNKPLSELNLITIHLGGGSSITAIKNGKPVDTSMGFTPLEGLMMMTRSGDIDPSISWFLQKKHKISVDKMEEILNKKSGVVAVSGISSSMVEVLKKARNGNKRAKLAIDMYAYKIKKYIGAYSAILGKVDAVVFSGAIGYGSAEIRNKCIKDVQTLSDVKTLKIKTDEGLAIAKTIAKAISKEEFKS